MPSAQVPAGASPLSDFDEAWREPHHGRQCRQIRSAAERLHERFAAGPRCLSVRALPLTTLGYPTRFAFQGTVQSPLPLITMTHRCLVVQFVQRGAVKTLLFNPTDIEGARQTPYFAALIDALGERLSSALTKQYAPLEEQLARLGIAPEDVDYVAFDHFHTQDLRRLLGTMDGRHPTRFPNAQLLAPEIEWSDWDDLHPMQRAWFVREGKEGVRTDRVVLTRADLELGDGVLLVRTPGHTTGNQTLFVATDTGVWGCSENGTCADNWAPRESRMRGMAKAARTLDVEVVLNANTPELGARQYTSMILERTLVSRVTRAPGFVQMYPSSEVTPSMLAPGLTPTWIHGELRHGTVVKSSSEAAQ